MEKKVLPLAIVLLGFCKAYSQVGINTGSPAATLDIKAKNATGTSTSVEGILITRLDRQRAQSMTGVPASTLIYVYSIATGSQTGTAVNIDAVGYYYYDGTTWVKLHNPTNSATGNIYTTNGTLTGNRTVTQGANTLAFTGTQANAFSVDGATFSVDAANDRVGIGTVSPKNKLVVKGVNAQPSVLGVSDTNATLRIDGDTNHSLDIGTYANSPYGSYISSQNKISAVGLPLVLNPVDGNVGIGTNTPDTKLTVSTPDNSFGFNHTNGTINLKSFVGSGYASFGTSTNNDLRFTANNFQTMSLTAGGNVGIGTMTPDTKLTISTPDNSFGFNHTNGTINLKSFVGSGYASFGTSTNNDLRFTANNFQTMSLTAGGNVGIGTMTPDTKLTISTPDNSFGFSHTNGTLNLKSYIGSGAVFFGSLTNNDLRFMTNNNSNLSITAGGNVGIGTNNPDTKLTIITPDLNYGFHHTNGTISLKSYIGAGFASFGTSTNNDLKITTNNIHRLSITSGGYVGIATATPTEILDVNGGARIRGVQEVVANSDDLLMIIQPDGKIKKGKVLKLSTQAVFPRTAQNIKWNNVPQYTGTYIQLPPGKWYLNATILLDSNGQITDNVTGWVRASFSESYSSFSFSNDIRGSYLISGSITGPASFGMLQGGIVLNNTTSQYKTYYFWKYSVFQMGAADTWDFKDFARGIAGEDQLIAIPME